MKKQFEQPEIIINKFEFSDVINMSGGDEITDPTPGETPGGTIEGGGVKW